MVSAYLIRAALGAEFRESHDVTEVNRHAVVVAGLDGLAFLQIFSDTPTYSVVLNHNNVMQ